MSALQDFKKRKINKNWSQVQILSEIAADADADADGVTSKEERNSIEKKLALKKGEKRVDFGPNPPPDLPINFSNKIRHMHGKDIVRVIQKPLYKSDISTGECRFSIPVKQVQQEFLTKHEKILLDACDSHNKKASRIEATLIDPSLNERKISLGKWEMKKNKNHIYGGGGGSSSYSSSSYVLMNKWCNIIEENQLKKGDVVQLWAFRAAAAASASTSSPRLCFALVVVKRSPSDDQQQQQQEDKESDSYDRVVSHGIRFPLF